METPKIALFFKFQRVKFNFKTSTPPPPTAALLPCHFHPEQLDSEQRQGVANSPPRHDDESCSTTRALPEQCNPRWRGCARFFEADGQIPDPPRVLGRHAACRACDAARKFLCCHPAVEPGFHATSGKRRHPLRVRARRRGEEFLRGGGRAGGHSPQRRQHSRSRGKNDIKDSQARPGEEREHLF